MKRIYAFEPDKENLARYVAAVKEKNMENAVLFIQKGLWSKTDVLYFSANNDCGKIDRKGSVKIDVTSIDETVSSIIGDLYIKMDIEGSEIEALKGAAQTIRKKNPYLQICLYHRMEDLYEVPALIRSINPNYTFYLREGVHPECLAVPHSK